MTLDSFSLTVDWDSQLTLIWDVIWTGLNCLNILNLVTWAKNKQGWIHFKYSALRPTELVSLLNFKSVFVCVRLCDDESHSVKVSPCLFFLKGVSVCEWVCVCTSAPASVCVCVCVGVCVCVCVGCLTERVSQSERVTLCLFSCQSDDSLEDVFALSHVDSQYSPTARCFHLGYTPTYTYTLIHTHTYTHPRHPSDVTQSPQQLPHWGRERGKWERDKRRTMFEDTVTREEWRENILCVYVCVCVCVCVWWLVLVPGHLHDNYLSSSVIRLISEQSVTMAANDKRLGLVKTLTYTDTPTKTHRIAHRGLCALLCFPSAGINWGFLVLGHIRKWKSEMPLRIVRIIGELCST